MKKIIFVFVLFIFGSSFSQTFEGIATYKSHRKMEDFKMGENNPQNEELKKQIMAQLSKQFQKEYTLKFNNKESVYIEVEKLNPPQPQMSGISIEVNSGSDVLYKNVKDQRFCNQTEIMGKQFLIKDSIRNDKWVLGKETKFIGQYECYKATYKDSYKTQTVENGEVTETEKERTVTAWYTPKISTSNGPEQYGGLPGLILEINDGQFTLVCSKIVLNPKEKIKIEEPKKGKIVTQKKFEEIMEKKNKEMMERFKGRNNNSDQVIIIGG